MPSRPSNRTAPFVYWAYVLLPDEKTPSARQWTLLLFFDKAPDGKSTSYECEVGCVSSSAPPALLSSGNRITLYVGVHEEVGVLEVL